MVLLLAALGVTRVAVVDSKNPIGFLEGADLLAVVAAQVEQVADSGGEDKNDHFFLLSMMSTMA